MANQSLLVMPTIELTDSSCTDPIRPNSSFPRATSILWSLLPAATYSLSHTMLSIWLAGLSILLARVALNTVGRFHIKACPASRQEECTRHSLLTPRARSHHSCAPTTQTGSAPSPRPGTLSQGWGG